ncbi:uncharacterized protein LOC118936380 isoform X5 [Oncorhynchus mykiss]|uniref:uncharacterized protein LOC118936380 isoform X5 n=2 Tax=Oncorhynchus mykiss TaxID=8022 RepID=UPI0018783A10|nr:uncharacterized protein LOC118936380 isoform X5 [Oncorhynchus mykiss]
MKNDILGLNYPEDSEVKDPLPQIELKAVTRRKVKTKRKTSANRPTVEQSTDTDAAEIDFVDNQNDEDEDEVKKDPLPQMEPDAVKRKKVKSLNEDDPHDHQSLEGQVQKMKNDILGLNYPEDSEVKDPLPQIELKAVTRRKVKTKRKTSANRPTVEQSTDTDAAEIDFVDNQNDEDEDEVKKDPLPQMEPDAVKRKKVKTKRTKRNKVEQITDTDAGPSTSVEFSGMTVQGTSHQGQSNECVSRACQTRALDLPPINPDAFNPVIIRFLEKLTEEQWRQLSIGRMDPVMRALLAEMCLEIVRFVSEAILEVIIPAIFRFVRIYSHVSPVSGKSLTESERSSSTNLKVRKRGSSKSSRSCTAKSSSSRNGSQTLLPNTQGDGESISSEPLSDFFGITEDSLLTGVQDSFKESLNNVLCIQREGQVDTQSLSRVIVGEVSKKVNSIISVAIQTPISGRMSPVIFASGGVSSTKVVEEMVSGISNILQMYINGKSVEQSVVLREDGVEVDMTHLTGQVMTALSGTVLNFSNKEENEPDKRELLCVVADHMKRLEACKSPEEMLKQGESNLNIKGTKSSLCLSTQSMDRLLTEEFQTKATESIREIVKRFRGCASCCSGTTSSSPTPRIGEIRDLMIDPEASELVSTFVSDMDNLTQSIRASCSPAQSEQILLENHQSKIWSYTVGCYYDMKNTLKRLLTCPEKWDLASTFVESTKDSFTMVPTLCLDIGHSSNGEADTSDSISCKPLLITSSSMNEQKGQSETPKPLLALKKYLQDQVLLDTAKAIASQVLVLYKTEVMEKFSSSVGECDSEESLEAILFVDGIMSDLNDFTSSCSASPSELLDSEQCLSHLTFPLGLQDSTTNSESTQSLPVINMKKLSSVSFQTKARKAVSEALRSVNPFTNSLLGDSEASKLLDTFVTDVETIVQSMQAHDSENFKMSKVSTLSAARIIYHRFREMLRWFLTPCQDSVKVIDGVTPIHNETLKQAPSESLDSQVTCSSDSLEIQADLQTCTKEVISQILTVYHSEESMEECISSLKGDTEDLSKLLDAVVSQIDVLAASKSYLFVYDYAVNTQDNLHGEINNIEEEASSRSLKSTAFDKLCTEEFQTKASHMAGGILQSGLIGIVNTNLDGRSVESSNESDVKILQKSGTPSLFTSSLHTNSAASNIVISITKDLNSFTQMTKMSDASVSGQLERSLSASTLPVSVHNGANVKGKIIWPGTVNLFNNVFTKVKDFFAQQQPVLLDNVVEAPKHAESICRTATSTQMTYSEHEGSQTSMVNYSKTLISQTLMTIQSRVSMSERMSTSEKGLLTCSIVGSMLEDVDMVRTDGNEIHRPSSSKSSLSITSAMTRGSQSDFTNSLPGTPVPNEWPVEIYCPIIRSSVIDMSDSSTHSQGSTNYTRQTISAIVNTVMEVIPRKDTEHIATADDVTSFTRRLARLSPRDGLQNFSHELTDKVYELIKSHNTPQALFVPAGKSVSDSILLKLKTGLNASEESREFPSDLVYSFATESIKRLLQQIVFWLPPPSQGSDFCQTVISDGSLQDTSQLIPSSSAISISSSQVYCDTKSLFTNIMVNQVMDTCSVASSSSEELSELMNIINGLSPTDAGTLDSDRPALMTTSRQSSAKSLPRTSLSGSSSTHNGGTVDIQVLGEVESKMDNKDLEMCSVSVYPSTPSAMDSDTHASFDSTSNDYTSLVLLLIVRLLSMITPITLLESSDIGETSRVLTKRILSEFCGTSGLEPTQAYPQNLKIKKIFKAVYKGLLQEFGSEKMLQVAMKSTDYAFDDALVKSLTRELLTKCNEASSSPPSMTQLSSHNALGSDEVGNSGLPTTGRKEKKRGRFSSLCGLNPKCTKKVNKKNHCIPTPSQNQTPAVSETAIVKDQESCQTESVCSTKKKPRKRSLISRMFSAIGKAFSSPFTSCYKKKST